MRLQRVIAGLAGLLLACGGDGPTASRMNSLRLVSVDSRPLPVTLSTGSGSNTMTLVSGTLSGSATGSACSWTIRNSLGTEAFGTIGDCPVAPDDVMTLVFSLGGHPWPSGTHSFRFEP